jgi:predicted nucleic acid-binding protein
MSVSQSTKCIRSWLKAPHVSVLEPGERRLDVLEELLVSIKVGRNLVHDAHLAALAIENRGVIYSNDRDFARFAGVRWRNPLDASS